MLEHCCDPSIRGNDAGGVRGEEKRFSVWISLLIRVKEASGMQGEGGRFSVWIFLLIAEKHDGGPSMKGDGLRAEGEFLVLFGLCREQLENHVLETRWFPSAVLTIIMGGGSIHIVSCLN